MGFEVEETLKQKLRQDKMLTHDFYLRMSGQVAWKPGEKQSMMSRIEQLDAEIASLRNRANAEWFENLPTGDADAR